MARIGVNINKREQERINKMLACRQPIIKQCEGCEDVDGKFCKCYTNPSVLFRNGNCPRASHLKEISESKKSLAKKRVGQQKQKKKTRGK